VSFGVYGGHFKRLGLIGIFVFIFLCFFFSGIEYMVYVCVALSVSFICFVRGLRAHLWQSTSRFSVSWITCLSFHIYVYIFGGYDPFYLVFILCFISI
jgi:hypothetical protein